MPNSQTEIDFENPWAFSVGFKINSYEKDFSCVKKKPTHILSKEAAVHF